MKPLAQIWRALTFIGVNETIDYDGRRRIVMTNIIALVLCGMILIVASILQAQPTFISSSIYLMIIPFVVLLSVLFFNKQGWNLVASIVVSSILPVSIVLIQVLAIIRAPVENILESDFYRPLLWTAASLTFPFITIDLKKKVVIFSIVIFSLLSGVIVNYLLHFWNKSFSDLGYNFNEYVTYYVTYLCVASLLIMSLYFLNNMSSHFQRKLQETQKKLSQSEKMASLTFLSANLAHEINNPLNYIHGGLSYIKKQLKGDEKLEEAFEHVDNGVIRISRIVNSLNYFRNSNSERKEEVEINNLIQDCILLFENQSNIRFNPKQVLMIIGNKPSLYQAFLNIIANAALATKDNGHINIDTHKAENHVEIQVSDDGKGIDQYTLEHIMEPLFDPGKEIGMGLSVAYKIIRDHSGTLDIQSDSGKGTQVRIMLPLFKNAV